MVTAEAADVVFHALANPHRRRVLERLSVAPATVTDLAAGFDMQLPSFVQHLAILEQSRLVKSVKHGRVRTFEIERETFRVAENWLDDRRREWEARLNAFDAYVLELKKQENQS